MTKSRIIAAVIGALTLVTVGVLGFVFVQKKAHGSDRYLGLIPANADIVVSLNLANIAEDAGINEEKVKQLFNLIKEQGVRVPEKVQDLILNPKKLGLRLDRNAYAWYSRTNECGGMAICMHDVGDFKDAMQLITKELDTDGVKFKERDGLTYIDIDDDNLSIIVDNEYLLITVAPQKNYYYYSPERNELTAFEQAKVWINQEGEAQYQETERFNRLEKAAGELKVDFNANIIADREWKELTKQAMIVADRSLLGGIISLELKRGAISLYAEGYCFDKNLQGMIDMVKNFVSPMNGALLANVPQDFIGWLGCNLQMSKILEAEQIKTLLMLASSQLDFDIAQLLKPLNGDVSAYITYDEDMQFCVQAQVDDNDMLDNMYNTLSHSRYVGDELTDCVERMGRNKYAIISKEYDWWTEEITKKQVAWLSADNNVLTINNSRFQQGGSTVLTEMKGELTNAALAIVLNEKGIVKAIEKNMSKASRHERREMQTYLPIIQLFSKLYLTIDEDLKVKATLTFKDPNQTVVSILEHIVAQAMGNKQMSYNIPDYEVVEEEDEPWEEYVEEAEVVVEEEEEEAEPWEEYVEEAEVEYIEDDWY